MLRWTGILLVVVTAGFSGQEYLRMLGNDPYLGRGSTVGSGFTTPGPPRLRILDPVPAAEGSPTAIENATVVVPSTWTPTSDGVWSTDPTEPSRVFYVRAVNVSLGVTARSTYGSLPGAGRVPRGDGVDMIRVDRYVDSPTTPGGVLGKRTWAVTGPSNQIVIATYVAPEAVFRSTVELVEPYGRSLTPDA